MDLLIGNTYGKYIARDENIPFVRLGFPILDRVGHAYFPTVGYRGAMRLLEKILNAFMDRQDREALRREIRTSDVGLATRMDARRRGRRAG